ncbi:dihydrofolate reductase [Lactobacillus pasteurii DSM 23907 = CRBIP 24.76]|uniref:Dihydrofolate reductase n=1 Tax=Lactobacillus pasteurii DSM 23907 = CRBIP 24.76 TaxID=1423790 RepID=I7JYL6_9LACO|nr:dihydrofolate reductase [Lactobacillus pasteurii]KRK08486.1 dihydrofolate reductase [Lactobacillus pasteurii DSM 23907 = CRBIP 24.76]TDG75665.1 hypothetical protein C5L33_000550 [Lactobacillus pasteurii]CCI85655.1 Dihydrofolate reductase [Lactobacillus pasteurii DSM 23907 = CRBIP 24.76]
MLTYVWTEGKNHEIGYQGHLPWHLPADLKHFKELTMGHEMLMGKGTFDSLPGLLPGRRHLVLTHEKKQDSQFADNSQVEFFDLPQLSAYLDEHQAESIMVIGGVSLFKLLCDQVDCLEMTKIDGEFAADTYMPDLDWEKFELIKSKSFAKDDRNSYNYKFLTFSKKQFDNIR